MVSNEWNTVLLKVHHYKFMIGVHTHSFVVEELIAAPHSWPERFRLKLRISSGYLTRSSMRSEKVFC